MKLNFIQDIASPHNNVFAEALHKSGKVDLNLWYCIQNAEKYGWKEDLNNKVKPALFYKQNSIDLQFLRHCLTKTDEKFLIVGWQNINTRILILLFFLLRRPYAVWFDYPHDEDNRGWLKNKVRAVYYKMLKWSRAHVFCVGKITVEYFKNKGFNLNRLTNLPIFVDVSKSPEDYKKYQKDIYKKYNVQKGDFLISAGSRLVYEKGFDILIDAIANLPNDIQKHVRCVIVGKGEELKNLKDQIQKNNLTKNLFMEGWMDFEEFSCIIANSHIFIHSARFDAFGATIFGHMFAVPVLGNVNAGAAYDRIVDGENGYLFECDSSTQLSTLIAKCFNERDSLKDMSVKARETALKFSPEKGVDILMKELS